MSTETTTQELPFPGDTNENSSPLLDYPSFSQGQAIVQQTRPQYSLNYRCSTIDTAEFTDKAPVSTGTQTAPLHFYEKSHVVKKHLLSYRGELLQQKLCNTEGTGTGKIGLFRIRDPHFKELCRRQVT